LAVLVNFVPWMIATPIILWLARRSPIAERRVVRPLLVQAGAAALLLPLITISAVALTTFLIPTRRQPSFQDTVSAMATRAFYAVPTYIAVAGIGQALAYFDRYRTRERLLARAELRALEAQLNPHFLFNALNAISAIGYRDPALADRALSHLSELLRLALEPRPQEISLREEIGFTRGYIDLYSIIMPDHVSFDLSVEHETWDAAVPTMLLQPLIENAIIHGIAKLTGGGHLSLAASRDRSRLRVVVANEVPPDNGDSHGTGLGLGNLRERLRVLYGDGAQLNLERGARQAIVVVELPYRDLVP
jgi:two-component system sensor histidine kinase AlgZ